MTRAEEFERLRPLLFSIAYRILGSVSEAEDAVQERRGPGDLAALRVLPDPTHVDQGLPLGGGHPDLDRRPALGPRPAGGVRRAVVPRAAAHRSLRGPGALGGAGRREREELAERFVDAIREGDLDGLRELLAADAQMISDGGGKAPQLPRAIIGAENVARVLAATVAQLVRIGVVVEPHEVNGQPGAIFRDRDAKVLSTLALDVLDGRIQTIRSVINPDKLEHLGPVADAWTLAREANRARRPTD